MVRRTSPRGDRDRPAAGRVHHAERIRAVATWLALALIMARPAYPSEDADTGSGLIMIALWGVVALLWAVASAARGECVLYARPIDALPVLLVAAAVLSSYFAMSRRPAINMASEWAGLVLSYLLVRQLFRAPAAQRALLVMMLAGSFALSAYGIYQAFWGIEADRDEYAKNRLEVLRALEIPPDSPREETFRNRLNSHEPFATFALANSLAGFLIGWLPIGLAMVGQRVWQNPAGGPHLEPAPQARSALRWVAKLIAAAAVIATIVLCLILTQSRTAYAALLFQLLLLGWFAVRRGSLRMPAGIDRRAVIAVAAAAVCFVAWAIHSAFHRAKIDASVFTLAARSLDFRLQYWRATLRLIADHPVTGVGPGNFRAHYLQYKLPESSEEISDPHNMVLEVAATIGWPGAAALVAMIVGSWILIWRVGGGTAGDGANLRIGLLLLAGPGGFLLAAMIHPGTIERYLLLIAAWIVGAVVFGQVGRSFEVRPGIIACATAGMTVHLLGAGGIAMPGVAQSLWILLALGLNGTDRDRVPIVFQSQAVARGSLAAIMFGLIWFGVSVLRPVSICQAALAGGRQAMSEGDWALAEVKLSRAIGSDSWAVEPWLELSRIHYEHWRRGRGRAADERFGQALAAIEAAVQRAPNELAPHARLAELFAARAEHEPRFWPRAADAFGQCVRLYPTNAELHARLARALWNAGDRDKARHEMDTAAELDRITPHADKKLTPADRIWIDRHRSDAAQEPNGLP